MDELTNEEFIGLLESINKKKQLEDLLDKDALNGIIDPQGVYPDKELSGEQKDIIKGILIAARPLTTNVREILDYEVDRLKAAEDRKAVERTENPEKPVPEAGDDGTERDVRSINPEKDDSAIENTTSTTNITFIINDYEEPTKQVDPPARNDDAPSKADEPVTEKPGGEKPRGNAPESPVDATPKDPDQDRLSPKELDAIQDYYRSTYENLLKEAIKDEARFFGVQSPLLQSAFDAIGDYALEKEDLKRIEKEFMELTKDTRDRTGVTVDPTIIVNTVGENGNFMFNGNIYNAPLDKEFNEPSSAIIPPGSVGTYSPQSTPTRVSDGKQEETKSQETSNKPISR